MAARSVNLLCGSVMRQGSKNLSTVCKEALSSKGPSHSQCRCAPAKISSRNFHLGHYDNGLFGPPAAENIFKRLAKRVGWTDTSRSV